MRVGGVAGRVGARSHSLAVDSLVPRLSLVAPPVVVARDALRDVAEDLIAHSEECL